MSKSTLKQYAGSLAAVAVATLVRLWLAPVLHNRAPLMTYVFAVSFAAWLGGLGPGLLALTLGGVIATFAFMAPGGTLLPESAESLIGLWLYYAIGLIIVLLGHSQRSARRRAEANALEALDRRAKLEAEIERRARVERDREQLLAEQAWLRATAEYQSAMLATLVEQAPIAIALYDTDLRHVLANSQTARMLGLPPDRVIGRTIRELVAGRLPDSLIDEVDGRFRRVLETGEPFSSRARESAFQGPGDEPRYFDWEIRRVDRPEGGTLGLLATFVDVTENINRQQALRQNEERFRLAAEAVNGLIYDADVITGRVERTRGLLELLGYHPEEVPPTRAWWLEQVHPDDLGQLLEAHARRKTPGARVASEYRVRHRDGRYVHLNDRSLSITDDDGEVVRYVGCNQDVTEIRQAERALREADARKNEFLAVLAHEIRNPLASIRNSLRLMRRQDGEGDPAEIDADGATAERQLAHLARLVDDLMDVSRITRGRVELRKQPMDLAGALGRAIEAIRPTIDRRGHDLTVDLPREPLPLEADPLRLEQVFGNLLNNAAKYTPPGGTIAVSARQEAGEAVLTIRDSGLGMSAEMLPRIFEMFVQDREHAGHSQGGLGIGLCLARSLVELHGGRIVARSDGPGAGSEFEVRLPLMANGTHGLNGSASDGLAGSPPAGTPRRRVMVVDDNEDVARSLARVLERVYRQEVRVANDGPSALDLAEAFRPDLILLDIGMPGMDGCEVARRLRTRPDFATTPIVALTGWGQEGDRKRSEEAGIDRHLVKPIDPDVLGELIASSR